MKKLYNKNELDKMSPQDLKDLAHDFEIKKVKSLKKKLVEQIYNHQKNQLAESSLMMFTKFKFNEQVVKYYSMSYLNAINKQELINIAKTLKIENAKQSTQQLIKEIFWHRNNISCNQNEKFACSLFNCCAHPVKQGVYDAEQIKLHPTNFARYGPSCWLIASIQLLSVINWCPEFTEFYQNPPQHVFSRFFDLIHKAKHDLSMQDFNPTPVTMAFIKRFKTGLQAGNLRHDIKPEEDWSFAKQQDATEFLQCFLNFLDTIG